MCLSDIYIGFGMRLSSAGGEKELEAIFLGFLSEVFLELPHFDLLGGLKVSPELPILWSITFLTIWTFLGVT